MEQEQEQPIDPVMEPARGDHNDPTVAVARRGDRGSSRAEPVRRGWWGRNQDFVMRHQEERIRRAAAALAAEGAGAARSSELASKKALVALRVPAAGELPEQDCAVCRRVPEQPIDPVMEITTTPTVAVARRGDRDSSHTEPPRGWWRRHQDFVLRLEQIRRAAAALTAEGDGASRGCEPASKKAMEALREPAAGEVSKQDCAVCLEDLTAGSRKLRTMNCSHSFHERCIFAWLDVDRRCPMCRFAMEARTNDEVEAGARG